MVSIKIGKKESLILILFIGTIIGALGVIAYGTNNPSVFGHDIGEIDGVIGEAIFLQNTATVHDGNQDVSIIQFNLNSINDLYKPDPTKDVKEILIKTHLETPPQDSIVEIKYYLPLTPPISPKIILHARSFDLGNKETQTNLVWLPVKDNAFSYGCEMYDSSLSQNCKIEILAYRY
jgi:hypothetical protein